MERQLADSRRGKNVQLPLTDLVRQSVAEPDRLQSGKSVALAGAARADRQVVDDQFTEADDENRRTVDQARALLLLVATGGKSSDAPALW